MDCIFAWSFFWELFYAGVYFRGRGSEDDGEVYVREGGESAGLSC